ncbi:MAG: outer membrane protein OmpK, partial [Aeromonas sp.]
GYGLKYFNEIYGIDNSADFKSTGFSHYFAVTYKF